MQDSSKIFVVLCKIQRKCGAVSLQNIYNKRTCCGPVKSECVLFLSVSRVVCLTISAVVLIFLLGADATCRSPSKCCPHCFCRIGMSLKGIPLDIPPNIRELHLCDNAISFTPAAVLNQLANCTKLELNKNQITTFDTQAFGGMESLENLDLGDNKIDCIPIFEQGTFRNLKSLNLSSNSISNVREGTLDFVQSIRQIGLSNNRLTTLSPDVFVNLIYPLDIGLSSSPGDTNQWECDSLCWLKHNEQLGRIYWFQSHFPRCRGGSDWSSLKCGDPGEAFV